jgi:hypothetical protein
MTFQLFLDSLNGETRERLSQAELREIYERAATEQKARKRKAPSWNPDTDSPWRVLDHCFIAVLKGCDEISTGDLETVLSRGKVPITGRRDDMIGNDRLPDYIEELVAAAERRQFFFTGNSIYTAYREPPDRVALFGPKSMLLHGSSYRPPAITFTNVRAHWPKLVKALQEAGFEISVTPKRARSRSIARRTTELRRPPAVSTARKRGRKPEKFEAVVAKMKEDIAEGRLTPETLDAKREKELEGDYSVSRDTARRARNVVLKRPSRR